ncbi:MAG: ADP-ribose pyrophosphatase [Gemmatimonadales bacterium]|nr:ADP-ribose pyrophosphatase [bacterium HR33]GIW52967.1 MAG: ADP-ribose pyrophosphatase [Gemmatimonadales bacterium]
MKPPPRNRLAVRRVYNGRIVNLDIETLRAPDGSTLELEIIRHAGAAAVVPVVAGDPEPSILLLRQYRYAADGILWEIPAGVLEPGESGIECARRELWEEAGAVAEKLEHMITIFTTPGFTDEQIQLFLAEGVSRRREPSPDADEFLEVVEVPLSEVLEMIHRGELNDAKSALAILYAARYRLRS